MSDKIKSTVFRRFLSVFTLALSWVPIFICYGAVSAISTTNKGIAAGAISHSPAILYVMLAFGVAGIISCIYGAYILWRAPK